MTENRTPDWYFRDWMEHFGKRQAALVNEVGWNKQKANYLWHGKQPYGRDIINEVSGWLEIEPYELLMPPSQALALRHLQASLKAIATEQGRALPPKPAGSRTTPARAAGK